MRILLLGGYGQTGRPLVRHLLERTHHELIIAGRNQDKAQAFTASLNDKRAIARQVDARDFASLREALQGMDMLLLACPTTDYVEQVVRAAIDARVDYLDLQLSESKLRTLREHQIEIGQAGLCFVTEAGYHPGLPSALVRFAAARLDRIESAVVGCFLNLRGDLPYTEAVDELTELFCNYPTEIFRAGRWIKPGASQLHKIEFGAPVGQRSCYSWCLEEMQGLPELLPSLNETGLYIASTGWLLDFVTMFLFLGLKVLPRNTHRVMGRALWWAMTSVSPPPYGVVLQVESMGEIRGRGVEHLLRLSHSDGYEFTAIPVAGLLMQYNEVRRPGVHCMGHLCDPVRLVADMQSMGIQAFERQETLSGSSRGGVP